MPKRRSASLFTLCLATTTGCYTMVPIASTPSPETRVVARMTDQGTFEMGNVIGTGAVQVEGVVASADADVWELRLLRVDHRDGVRAEWSEERVAFRRTFLEAPLEKRLDRTRTWFSAGVAAVGMVLAGRLFLGVAAGGDDPGGGPPPQN